MGFLLILFALISDSSYSELYLKCWGIIKEVTFISDMMVKM